VIKACISKDVSETSAPSTGVGSTNKILRAGYPPASLSQAISTTVIRTKAIILLIFGFPLESC
ncbi:MAG: hypothetical protein ACYSWZ_23500, partial [Planctomycetota bacterium]